MTVYDRWLEQPYQDEYERQDAIDELTEELLEGECNPQNPSVFLEAINEGACLSTDEAYKELQAILHRGHGYDDIGRLVWNAVSDYCADTARDRAESIIIHGKKG